MKKILSYSLVILLAFLIPGCSGDDVKKYKGTYNGTFSFLKEDGKTKDGKVIIAVNPIKENSILLYGVIGMDNVSSGVYKTNTTDAAIIVKILSSIGVDMGTTAEETIKNMTITATFSGSNHLEMVFSYEVDVLGIATLDVRVINFNGNK